MSDVNWWLMALAFVLGLVLTLALTLRRVKREVPVYGALGRRPDTGGDARARGATAAGASAAGTSAAATAATDDATTKLPKVGAVDEPTTQLPKVSSAGAAAAGAAAAGAAGAAKFASGGADADAKEPGADVGEDVKLVEATPYGAGSIRVSGAGTPTGYLIKGNEDSMLYHSPESPSYSVTIAEIWFADVESAEKAGFNRWDSGKSQRQKK
ncbi:channel accessory protein ArfC, sunset domain variant [Mycolicibacterium houstonense]|uniref:channel accessory protein ArfC, sunset domain variant n=1 Tax=Mycolicibacterium houstonense TaxID=146021 RepID=UPI003F9A7146